jgi:hypothetical protein
MKILISYVSNKDSRFAEINTIEYLINLTEEEGSDIILCQKKPRSADLEIIVYDDYIE